MITKHFPYVCLRRSVDALHPGARPTGAISQQTHCFQKENSCGGTYPFENIPTNLLFRISFAIAIPNCCLDIIELLSNGIRGYAHIFLQHIFFEWTGFKNFAIRQIHGSSPSRMIESMDDRVIDVLCPASYLCPFFEVVCRVFKFFVRIHFRVRICVDQSLDQRFGTARDIHHCVGRPL